MTRLSNRQFPMLQAFAASHDYMSIREAQAFDQRPFRSMLIQKWITYVSKRGFRITAKGEAAFEEFLSTDIARKNQNAPLTKYFDPEVYGLHVVSPPKRKKKIA